MENNYTKFKQTTTTIHRESFSKQLKLVFKDEKYSRFDHIVTVWKKIGLNTTLSSAPIIEDLAKLFNEVQWQGKYGGLKAAYESHVPEKFLDEYRKVMFGQMQRGGSSFEITIKTLANIVSHISSRQLEAAMVNVNVPIALRNELFYRHFRIDDLLDSEKCKKVWSSLDSITCQALCFDKKSVTEMSMILRLDTKKIIDSFGESPYWPVKISLYGSIESFIEIVKSLTTYVRSKINAKTKQPATSICNISKTTEIENSHETAETASQQRENFEHFEIFEKKEITQMRVTNELGTLTDEQEKQDSNERKADEAPKLLKPETFKTKEEKSNREIMSSSDDFLSDFELDEEMKEKMKIFNEEVLGIKDSIESESAVEKQVKSEIGVSKPEEQTDTQHCFNSIQETLDESLNSLTIQNTGSAAETHPGTPFPSTREKKQRKKPRGKRGKNKFAMGSSESVLTLEDLRGKIFATERKTRGPFLPNTEDEMEADERDKPSPYGNFHPDDFVRDPPAPAPPTQSANSFSFLQQYNQNNPSLSNPSVGSTPSAESAQPSQSIGSSQQNKQPVSLDRKKGFFNEQGISKFRFVANQNYTRNRVNPDMYPEMYKNLGRKPRSVDGSSARNKLGRSNEAQEKVWEDEDNESDEERWEASLYRNAKIRERNIQEKSASSFMNPESVNSQNFDSRGEFLASLLNSKKTFYCSEGNTGFEDLENLENLENSENSENSEKLEKLENRNSKAKKKKKEKSKAHKSDKEFFDKKEKKSRTSIRELDKFEFEQQTEETDIVNEKKAIDKQVEKDQEKLPLRAMMSVKKIFASYGPWTCKCGRPVDRKFFKCAGCSFVNSELKKRESGLKPGQVISYNKQKGVGTLAPDSNPDAVVLFYKYHVWSADLVVYPSEKIFYRSDTKIGKEIATIVFSRFSARRIMIGECEELHPHLDYGWIRIKKGGRNKCPIFFRVSDYESGQTLHVGMAVRFLADFSLVQPRAFNVRPVVEKNIDFDFVKNVSSSARHNKNDKNKEKHARANLNKSLTGKVIEWEKDQGFIKPDAGGDKVLVTNVDALTPNHAFEVGQEVEFMVDRSHLLETGYLCARNVIKINPKEELFGTIANVKSNFGFIKTKLQWQLEDIYFRSHEAYYEFGRMKAGDKVRFFLGIGRNGIQAVSVEIEETSF